MLPNLNDCCIAVILGLGYVGLPLAVEFGKSNSHNQSSEIVSSRVLG